MDIEEFFKNAFKKLDIDLPFNQVKSNITNYQKYTLSVTLSPSVMDTEEVYYNLLREKITNEIKQYTLKVIISDIKSKGDINFIDILNKGLKGAQSHHMIDNSRKIITEIKNLNLPNIITNGRICSEYIMDSSVYNNEPLNNTLLNQFNTLTKHGNLFGDIDVYIDSFMRWDDDFLLSYDDVQYDISDIKINITQESTFSPVLKVAFILYYNIINPKLTYIIDNINSISYLMYKPFLRNKRIDNLLE
jgi:hypothetical protein